MPLTVTKTLRAARQLVENEENWWQAIGPRRTRVAGYCPVLALREVTRGCEALWSPVPAAAGTAFARAAGLNPVGWGSSVAEWNDAPERTHDEVLAAFDRAIANERYRAVEAVA